MLTVKLNSSGLEAFRLDRLGPGRIGLDRVGLDRVGLITCESWDLS